MLNTNPKSAFFRQAHRQLPLRVAIAGFGSIGRLVGEHLDRGVEGLELVAVSARDLARASKHLAGFRNKVEAAPLAELAAGADVLVECTPPERFREAVMPAIQRGCTVLTVSATALLEHADICERAAEKGARIVLVSGSVAGLDAIRAAMIGTVRAVRMVTRKPPLSLAKSDWVKRRGIDVARITEPMRIFEGTAREAAIAFPDKFNLAATVALASIGPDRVRIEIWLDPAVERNVHRISLDADSTRLEVEIQNVPNPGHEGTGPLVAYSIIAALKDLVSAFRVGT
jgi:aspartate dehydrogenase